MLDIFRSSDGNMLVVSSTDGFCSVIKFKPDEIGSLYTEAEEDLENTTSQDESMLEEAMDEDDDVEDLEDEDHVPVSKEGIPLNKEGVCSPADIKIKSVKEGGRPNPRRLQLITISSPKSKNEEAIDENDLNLILEETVAEPTSSNNDDKTNQVQHKKRVPFVTLSSSGKS